MKIALFFFLIASSAISQKKTYDFSPVDKLIDGAISNHDFPSAVLVIGNSNGIIYQNAYGRLTYDDDAQPTTMKTIYDLASVTKVIATTSAIMILYEEGKVDLSAPVITYIPEFAANGKGDITVMNLLLHNSGLTAWTPFYQTMTTPEEVRNAVFNCSKEYPTGSKMVYSDYNGFLLGEIVERVSGMKLDKFCKKYIFDNLGMTDTDYLIPLSENYRIAPTEYDTYWRNELLIGYVHDEMAALLGGVSGNAGLFSTGPDLFRFMQMMLNKGIYGSNSERGTTRPDTLFSANTVTLFTTKVTGLGYNNSRALGWDTKPEPTHYPPPCSERFSEDSFGHTGYTGTSVWCDREKDLIVIFLTNRVYPKRGNEAILEVRPKVHEEVCKIMGY